MGFWLVCLQVYSSASPLRLRPQRVGLAFASDAASGCKPEFSHVLHFAAIFMMPLFLETLLNQSLRPTVRRLSKPLNPCAHSTKRLFLLLECLD